MVEPAAGVCADRKVGELGVVKALSECTLREVGVVTAMANTAVRTRFSGNKSQDQGGEKECGAERRGEHGVKTVGNGGLRLLQGRGREAEGKGEGAKSNTLYVPINYNGSASVWIRLSRDGSGGAASVPVTPDNVTAKVTAGLRALGERDVLLGTDLAVRRQLEARGVTSTAGWSPFRSYATVHLWRPYV